MGERKGIYRVVVGKPEGKRPLGRPRHRWEDNMRDADKSLTPTTSRCCRTGSIVSLERGFCSCAELQVFSCYRGWKEACKATRVISTTSRRELSSSSPPPQGKVLKEIRTILTETLGEHAPSYATVKNWVARFKPGDFSTCVARRPGWLKTVTTLEIIAKIHELILEDCRILAKSIAQQLGISREPVGSIVSWRFGHAEALREVGPEMPEHRLKKKSTVPVAWATYGIFSVRSKWFCVAIGDHRRKLVILLWPGDKATISGVVA